MKIKKIIFGIVFSFLFVVNFSAQKKSHAEMANRKTATRFLRLAENSFSQKEFDKALSQTEMGLSYDERVSDLLYLKAAIFSEQKKSRAKIFSLLEKAFSYNDWTSYNEEAARILFANVLCDRGNMQKAISVLDEKNVLFSSDAEFIRAKAFYKMHTKDSITKARNKIATSRKIYANDVRFAKLFFKNEFVLAENPRPKIVKQIAESIIEEIPDYDANDNELEIFAIYFSEGETKTRLLQSFSAHNLRHPLYAILAVNEKNISQTEAVEYFFSFAENHIDLSLLEEFSKTITEADAKKLLHDYLASFSGVVTVDTDFDTNANLRIDYERGRPAIVTIDRNNDDEDEWTAVCDFGEVRALEKNNVTLNFSTYPFVKSANVKTKTNEQNIEQTSERKFLLAEKTFSFKPFTIEKNKIISANANVDFFVANPTSEELDLSEHELFLASTKYETPIAEKENASAQFLVLNGIIQSAEFFADGKKYAKANFKNGLPRSRAIDNDGDGVFEETQFYSYDANTKRNDQAAFQNIFFLPENSHFYISKITLDVNADSLVDFTTEYKANGSKISSWDFDNNGEWEMQAISYAQNKNESEVRFYRLPEKKLVTITSVNDEPKFVMQDDIRFDVQKGFEKDVFWIGESGNESDERAALASLASVKLQGVCTLVENANHRVLAVRIGKFRYCSLILDAEKIESSTEAETKANATQSSTEAEVKTNATQSSNEMKTQAE